MRTQNESTLTVVMVVTGGVCVCVEVCVWGGGRSVDWKTSLECVSREISEGRVSPCGLYSTGNPFRSIEAEGVDKGWVVAGEYFSVLYCCNKMFE